ncbi:ribonuclease H-like domain-containing protein [Tanacetum coccineum]
MVTPNEGRVNGACKARWQPPHQANPTLQPAKACIGLVKDQTSTARRKHYSLLSKRIMNEFCEMKGIRREFSVARTPQQNDVAEKKNKTLIEAAMTMLTDSKLPTTFWAEAVNTACYVQNRVLVIKPHNKTPYELFLGRKPALSFIRPFGCLVTILNTLDHLGKFDGKSDDGFFIGYSINSKAFRVFNTRTRFVEENLHINFLKNKPNVARTGPNWMFDIDTLTMSMNYQPVFARNQTNGPKSSNDEVADDAGKKNEAQDPVKEGEATNTNSTNKVNTVSSSVNVVSSSFTTVESGRERTERNEFESVFGQDKDNGKNTYRMFTPVNAAGSSYEKIIKSAYLPIEAMQEELLQFKLQKVWTLVDLSKGKRAIGTKWVYRNKKDERGIVVFEQLMAQSGTDLKMAKLGVIRLVAQGYTQEEGIDYDELDVKSAFLYGTIEEEVYVDDIIFGSTKKSLCIEFEGLMHKKFQISSMGELTFFLGLQVMQRDDGIFINQEKYVAVILKKFDFSLVKTASTPIETKKALLKDEEANDTSHLHAVKRVFKYLKGQPKLGLWYPRDSPFDLEAFSNSNYARASLDRKSTIGGFQFLGKRLISWQCKKQTIVANSTTEAEYVAAANYCRQVLWIQNQMLDYGFNFMNTDMC